MGFVPQLFFYVRFELDLDCTVVESRYRQYLLLLVTVHRLSFILEYNLATVPLISDCSFRHQILMTIIGGFHRYLVADLVILFNNVQGLGLAILNRR